MRGEEGAVLVQLQRPLDQARIDRYAQVSGDRNPLHVDPAFAAASQFGGTVAHGLLLLAYASEALARAWGLRWLESGRLRARFRAPARPGQLLTVRVLAAQGATAALVQVLDQGGQVLLSAEAQLPLAPSGHPQKGGDSPG